MSKCVCDPKVRNLGLPLCDYPEVGKDYGRILVPELNENGERNHIDLTKSFDQTCLNQFLCAVNLPSRWRPFPEIKNIISEDEDDVYETFNDGSECFVRPGKEKRMFVIPFEKNGVAELMRDNINALAACGGLNMYDVFACGTIRGLCSNDKLYPYRVTNVRAKFIKGDGSTCDKVEVKYELATKSTGTVGYIFGGTHDADVVGACPLNDLTVDIDVSTLQVSGFDFKLRKPIKQFLYKGLVATDLVVTLAGNAVTPTITEVDGLYSISIPGGNAGDVVTINWDALLKKGYDAGGATTVTLPTP